MYFLFPSRFAHTSNQTVLNSPMSERLSTSAGATIPSNRIVASDGNEATPTDSGTSGERSGRYPGWCVQCSSMGRIDHSTRSLPSPSTTAIKRTRAWGCWGHAGVAMATWLVPRGVGPAGRLGQQPCGPHHQARCLPRWSRHDSGAHHTPPHIYLDRGRRARSVLLLGDYRRVRPV